MVFEIRLMHVQGRLFDFDYIEIFGFNDHIHGCGGGGDCSAVSGGFDGGGRGGGGIGSCRGGMTAQG